MNRQPPNNLSAVEAADKIREGWFTSVELVRACLAHIDATDGQIHAWVHIDREGALAQAERMDEIRRAGRAMGPLHGVPVGLKDIIDTAGQPTQRGSPIFEGRQPEADAALVDRLKEAGAVILGKTVTTELAFMHPSVTRNPHNTGHTPGGSSSGSAAAVAAYHVPLAVGTQTNGSVLRPASYCGVYGFKPTRGVISRRGVLQTCATLDQIGVMARTLEDAALLADALGGYDPIDADSFGWPRPAMRDGYLADVPVPPSLAVYDLPFDDRRTPDMVEAMDEVIEILGADRVERLPAPPAFANLQKVQRTIHLYELVRHLKGPFEDHWDQLSATMQPLVTEGRAISDAEYEDAVELRRLSQEYFTEFFYDYDAVLCPAATGEAPRIEEGVGDPIYSTLWTLAGLPCLSLPLMTGARGLPMGLQLVGSFEGDDRLFRTARWLEKTLTTE